MTTKDGAAAQRKYYEKISEDPVREIVESIAPMAAKLQPDGLHVPKEFAWGENGPIIIVEDRDAHTQARRSQRFDKADLLKTFQHARSVSIVPYAPRRDGSRVGIIEAGWQSITLHSRLLDGCAVIILTTSDRVRHWSTEARKHCSSEAVIEFFDAKGVARVMEGGV